MKSRKVTTLESIIRFLTKNVDLTLFSLRVSEKCTGQKELEGFEWREPVYRIEVWPKSMVNEKIAYGFDWIMGTEIRMLLPYQIIRK